MTSFSRLRLKFFVILLFLGIGIFIVNVASNSFGTEDTDIYNYILEALALGTAAMVGYFEWKRITRETDEQIKIEAKKILEANYNKEQSLKHNTEYNKHNP